MKKIASRALNYDAAREIFLLMKALQTSKQTVVRRARGPVARAVRIMCAHAVRTAPGRAQSIDLQVQQDNMLLVTCLTSPARKHG